ncbi:MAG TPA: D-alanine--D-alanine ligase [Ignavibacteriaceae bacterium]|nr:D-alanine--D-alanine ligase [Ignavibacteriaceae bacterium]
MEKKKNRIALLLGGTSPERKVSKATGASIYKALINLGYQTFLVNPAYGDKQPKNSEDFFKDEDYSEISNENYIKALNLEILNSVDLAFLALHGKWGEDGTIQSMLELKGIKYTGSKILSSAITMDKTMSKILFQHNNVRTPLWITVNADYNLSLLKKEIDSKLKYPCVIKPNDQGSTVGLTICKNENEIEEAIKLSLQFSNKALIEEYIPGREMTVAIVEDEVFPVLEIKPKHSLYDYECKYTPGMSEYEVPAKISEDVSDMMKKSAQTAFKSLGCEGYARVDFRLSPANIDYCLEINSLPGMTSTSLVPKMAKAVGISFEELVDRIVKISLK